MKKITRRWKRRLEKGLLVFTTDPKSPTHQKRLIRGEKDFASGLVSGLSEKEALEKAFSNAAGGTNAKYNAALAAAYKASVARAIANKAAATGKTYFSKLGQAIKSASTSCWLLLIAVVTFVVCTSLAVASVEWLKWLFWIMVALAIFLVLILKPRKLFKVLVFLSLIVAIIVVFAAFAAHNPTAPEGDTTPTTTPTATVTPTPTATVTPTPISPADKALQDAGWLPNQYVKDSDVDESKDKSTTGNLGFNLDGSKTLPLMFSFLGSGEKSAEALIKTKMEGTGATRAEVLDVKNWTIFQSLIDFQYPGNTSYDNGGVVGAGNRDGKAGDIFFGFTCPTTGKVMFTRGACGNPQTIVPQPKPTPTPTPTEKPTPTPTPKPIPTPTLQPKSSDPEDYKHPGDGTEPDAGTGTKPPVPTVSTPAELTPPSVNTVPTKAIVAPGATPLPTQAPKATPTVAIVAPKATPVPTQAPKATPTPTLAPEPSINPTDGTPNSGDPGNPFS